MTCFKIMKLVIDKTAKAVFGQIELTEEQGNTVRGHLEAMSNALNTGGAPDYSDPVRRFAYVYCYPAAHAHLFERACVASAEICRLVRLKVKAGQPLRVCVFGGGPGTEVVGLAKFLARQVAEDESLGVEVLLLDREPGWQENVSITVECVGEELTRLAVDVTFDLRWEGFNFCGEGQNAIDKIGGKDIYVFNYALSEAPRGDESLKKLIASLAASMPEEAVMVIADREEKELVRIASNMLESAGLVITSRATGVKNMDPAEDCNEIKKAYYDRIRRSPRVQFGKVGMNQGAFWVVGTKKSPQ
jgi:hypothetical protein